MLKTGPPTDPLLPTRKPPGIPRAQSAGPNNARNRSPMNFVKKPCGERRCQSLSPTNVKKPTTTRGLAQETVSVPANTNLNAVANSSEDSGSSTNLPQFVVTKIMRALTTKKREFFKLRKTVIAHQNTLLEHYASIRELETRVGSPPDITVGDVRMMSLTSWPAHDLLMLVRDDIQLTDTSELSGVFGPQILQQVKAQLGAIPEVVNRVGSQLLNRRLEILNQLRMKHRADRATYHTSLEWKSKNTELEQESEQMQAMVTEAKENVAAKISSIYKLSKIPWIDRDDMVKKIEKLHRDNLILHNKLVDEGRSKDRKPENRVDNTTLTTKTEHSNSHQALTAELQKERSARESLKDVLANADSMLRAARNRITALERQLKDTKAELETNKKKHKDLEQLYRHRESNFDARSKKLMEMSKTGEVAIDALARQRDALELRVRELRAQAEAAECEAEQRAAEQRARADSLQAKVAAQEKNMQAAEVRAAELEMRVKDFEEQLQHIRERTAKLLEIEKKRCIDLIPSKESEPTDRETEIWKELQVTRVALSRAEEELRQSRADKDNFLDSLSRIAQGDGSTNVEDKMATELLERERKIAKLQKTIDAQQENEKLMEQTMTQYENQLADLRLEVKRLRNYEFYSMEIPYQELQTESLELHMKLEELSRERSALVSAAASRALMLERHERAATLFARVTRARRDLAALLDPAAEPTTLDDVSYSEVTRSLTSVCASAADTWSALRAERARVLRLERAVLTQSLQLEREGRVRTQLERRRAFLERQLQRPEPCASVFSGPSQNSSVTRR